MHEVKTSVNAMLNRLTYLHKRQHASVARGINAAIVSEIKPKRYSKQSETQIDNDVSNNIFNFYEAI